MRKLLLLLLLPLQIMAQSGSFRPFSKYPFPSDLTASSGTASIAWTMDEEGRRNLYVAKGPDFQPRKITDFSKDDGQEITNISISDDGHWVVFVRGGDHGANWDPDAPVNPAFDTEPFKVQVAILPFAGGQVKYLSEGDDPVLSPDSKEVAFIKNGQAWSALLDSAAPAKALFTTRGKVGSLQWSPDSKRLLFVSTRTDHAIIGIYTKGSSTLKWIAPSFSRDAFPQWSDDGSRIVFVRRPGAGGVPDSILVNKPDAWSIFIADTATGLARLLWKSPNTLRGSYPTTDGGANLHWAAGNRIVFLSYQDGWPHLYSIEADAYASAKTSPGNPGVSATLLTPGDLMCEHIRLSPDKKFLLFSANTGPDQHDIERRHAVMVSVDKPDMQVMTPGRDLEWTPALTGDGNTLIFLSATSKRPPLPAIMTLKTTQVKAFGYCAKRISPRIFLSTGS